MRNLPVNKGAFTVLLMFECPAGESERFALELADYVETRMRFHPGFLSSLIYLSEDAQRIVELFQWARAEDWEAFRASDDGRKAVEQLAGRVPKIEFLEMVRAIGPPPPGQEFPDAGHA